MRAPRTSLFCVLSALMVVVLLLLVVSSAPATAITTAVDPGDLFVAQAVVPAGHLLLFSFQLHPDYLLTVSVKDRDTGLLLHWWRDEEFGTASIESSNERHVYDFIFDNSNSVLTYKNVNFDIRVVPDPEHNIDRSQLDPIEAKIRALTTRMHKLKGLQQTLRYQQKNHRATVEDASERVLLWSILQLVGFVVVCGGQLLLLKFFLEKKRTI